MRSRTVLLVLAVTAFCHPVWAAEAAPPLPGGEASYRAGDFKAAAAAFKDLAEGAGSASSRAHYNLGNAYFRLGQKGKALASFLRAQALDPRDADIRWNIDVIKARLKDRIEEPFDFGPAGVAKQVLFFISLRETALLFSLNLFLGCLWMLAGCLLAPLRLFARRTRALVLLSVIFFGGVMGLKVWTIGEPVVVVTAEQAVARYGPNANEAKAFTLHAGAEARLLDSTENWHYIRLANRNVGWIEKQAAEIV